MMCTFDVIAYDIKEAMKVAEEIAAQFFAMHAEYLDVIPVRSERLIDGPDKASRWRVFFEATPKLVADT